MKELHRFLRRVYSQRFPELENLVLDPAKFAKVILQLQKAKVIFFYIKNITKIDLGEILDSNTAVAIKIAASNNSFDNELTNNEFETCFEGCNFLLELINLKSKVTLL